MSRGAGAARRPRVLVVDNYDSFTWNLVGPLRAWGCEVLVVRNDVAPVDDLLAWGPDRVLLSPGPNRPEEAGVCVDLVQAAAARALPLLGVCLGHQALAVAFGGAVVRARRPRHGLPSPVAHDGRGLLRGLPSPFAAGRYHSLVVRRRGLPRSLEETARALDDGALMGLRHRRLPLEGVQFHPESHLSPHGLALLARFAGVGPSDARGLVLSDRPQGGRPAPDRARSGGQGWSLARARRRA